MAVTLGVTGDLEGRTDLINNKYINFSLSLSFKRGKKRKQVHFSRETIVRAVTKERGSRYR